MEKNQKRNSEFQLPEEIIQHIHSFMNEREAARTTLLSSSWHRAWTTRPNLKLDQYHFGRYSKEFGESTKKTMQRYEDRGLKMNTFHLRMMRMFANHSFAPELILKAIKLGAVALEIDIPEPFVLPDEVFQCETLTRLSLNECTFRRRKKEITNCSNLKSLTLSSVTITRGLIRDLISRCPLIEELTLVELRKPSGILFPLDIGMLHKLRMLKYLRLEGLNTGDSLCRSDLWPKLACLKELVIRDFHSDVRICSTSLERITIRSYHCKNMNAEFDVPNIRMFRLKGIDLLRLDLKPSTREWEADVHIRCSLYSNAKASWFSSLNQLVKMLGRSRLSLTVFLCCWPGHGDEYWGDGLAIPALEDLKIMGCAALSPCFLEALLWSCDPNFVTLKTRSVPGLEKGNVEGFKKLQSLPWKTLLDASRGDEDFVRFQLK